MADRNRFDDWLERGLRAELGPTASAPPPVIPAYARLVERPRLRLPLLAGVGTALASKAATGLAMTAFAVGLTGAAAVQTVTTGSPVPPPVEVRLRAVAQDLGAVAPAAPAAPAVPSQALAPAAEQPATPLPAAGPTNSPSRPASGPPPAPVHTGSELGRVDRSRSQAPALAPVGPDDSPAGRPSSRPTAAGSPTPAPIRPTHRPAPTEPAEPSGGARGGGHSRGEGERD